MNENQDFNKYPMEEPDKIPYNLTCSCHPNNGGSGICGCVMANTMVDNPRKYGAPKTNIVTATDFIVSQRTFIAKSQDDEDYVLNKSINILSSLINIAEKDSKNSRELIEDAKEWLNELENKQINK